MTVVENLNPRVQYTYIEDTQTYPITFPYIHPSYVKCMIREQELTYNVHYTIPAFDAEAMAHDELYMTLLISPTSDLGDGITVAVGDEITIYRSTPLDQQAEFPQTAKFSSQKITEALDKLTHQQQEQQDDLDVCLRLSKNIPVGFNTELPSPAANQVIQWSEDGTQLINYDLRGEITTIDNKANTAIDTANAASNKADTAITKADNAVSTANTANDKSDTAVTKANNADNKADNAVSTANTADGKANNAVSTANTAKNTADTAKETADAAKDKVDALEENIEVVIEAAEKIAELEEAVQTATEAAEQASSDAQAASDAADRAEAVIPSQSGQNGKYLKTNGTSTSWENVPDGLPSQSGKNGKFLKTDGTNASWEDVPEELPSQSGQSGKFLTTDGSNPSWSDVDSLPSQSGQSGKFLTTDGTDASWAEVQSGSSRNIGEIVTSTVPLTDAGLHLLDGALLQYGSYSAFIDYIADLYDSGDYTDIFETEANWQQAVTDYGVCGKFVYDSVNNTVRLPKYNSKIYTGGGETPVIGNGKTLGLTNGTRNFGLAQGTNSYAFGATYAYDTAVSSTLAGSETTYSAMLGVTEDASKSGLIADLANITTSLDGYYYIVVATVTKTDIEVDIDEIATDLNSKVDKTDLVSVHVVVETYINGASWYRVYDDNWCEQGFAATSGTAIALLKEFKDPNYSVSCATSAKSETSVTPSATGSCICYGYLADTGV